MARLLHALLFMIWSSPRPARGLLLLVCTAIAWPAVPAWTQDLPDLGKKVRCDGDGLPLPEGALLRLGTQRLRHGGGNPNLPGLAFHPDGKSLLSQRYCSREICRWDLTTGKKLKPLVEAKDCIALLAVSADRTLLAWCLHAGADIHLHDLAHAKEVILKGPWECTWSLAFSPDARMLVAMGKSVGKEDSKAFCYDLSTHKMVRCMDLSGIYRGGPGAIAISPDKKTLCICCHYPGRLERWDLTRGRPLAPLAKGDFSTVHFLPDGILVSGGEARKDGEPTVRFWDVVSGKELRTLRTQVPNVGALAVSPDGKTLAVGTGGGSYYGAHRPGGDVILWDLASGREIRRFGPTGLGLRVVAFSPGGDLLAAASEEDQIYVWNVETGKPLLPAETRKGVRNLFLRLLATKVSLAKKVPGRQRKVVQTVHL